MSAGFGRSGSGHMRAHTRQTQHIRLHPVQTQKNKTNQTVLVNTSSSQMPELKEKESSIDYQDILRGKSVPMGADP